MTPESFVETMRSAKASAILRTDKAEAAAPAMEAAVRGGFTVIEFTLTTPGAFEMIAEFSKRDGLVVGAGTVLTADDALRATEAGAQFLVSPVLEASAMAEAIRLGVAFMPGTYTPTEMLTAHRLGAAAVKLFPGPGTGPKFVKSVLAPLPMLNIIPTNAVHENNAASYLKAGALAVGFAASLFDRNSLMKNDFDAIEATARKLIAAVHPTR